MTTEAFDDPMSPIYLHKWFYTLCYGILLGWSVRFNVFVAPKSRDKALARVGVLGIMVKSKDRSVFVTRRSSYEDLQDRA